MAVVPLGPILTAKGQLVWRSGSLFSILSFPDADVVPGNELAHPEGKDPAIKIPKKVNPLRFRAVISM